MHHLDIPCKCREARKTHTFKAIPHERKVFLATSGDLYFGRRQLRKSQKPVSLEADWDGNREIRSL
jgi:hypothetical protein